MSAGTERILDISEGGSHLRIEDRQLIVESKNAAARHFPVDELAVLILAQPWLTLTQSVLAAVAEAGGVVIVSDGRCMPVALSLPLFGRSLQAQRLRSQIEASLPTTKRLWQSLVMGKIAHQSMILNRLGREDAGLQALVARVRSGDPENLEAQAARRNCIRDHMPEEGQVRVLLLTDHQFGKMEYYAGKARREPEKRPLQLEFL